MVTARLLIRPAPSGSRARACYILRSPWHSMDPDLNRSECACRWPGSLIGTALVASVLLATSEGVAAPSGAYGPMPLEKPFQRELLRQAQGLGVEFERLGLVIDEGPYAEWIQAVGARLAPEPTAWIHSA